MPAMMQIYANIEENDTAEKHRKDPERMIPRGNRAGSHGPNLFFCQL